MKDMQARHARDFKSQEDDFTAQLKRLQEQNEQNEARFLRDLNEQKDINNKQEMDHQ